MKKMRFLLGLVLLSLCLPVFAFENYFRPGTEWTLEVGGIGADGYPIPVRIEKNSIGAEINVKGENVLPFYVGEELTYYLRTVGDKVYLSYLDTEYPEWHLMYDFGLRKGESVEVIDLHYNQDNITYTALNCVSVGIPAPYTKSQWMFLEHGDYLYESAEWILGIGSWRGPLQNTVLWDGGLGYSLLKVTSNGETVFIADSSEVKTVETEKADIRAEGSDVLISNVANGTPVNVYDANGNRVKSIHATEGITIVHLDIPGLYVVSVGSNAVKIMVN